MKNSKLEIDPSSGRLSYEDQDQKFYIDGKLTNQQFKGVVSLDNDLTHYQNYTVNSALAIRADADPIIGGSAEIRLIGDGSTTPTFVGMTASASSSAYDATLAAINKVVFYYDGTTVFYSITVL